MPALPDGLRHSLRSARAAIGGGRRSASTSAAAPAPASEDDERRLLERLSPQIDGPAPIDGPMVSMIMLSRDGEGLLRRSLPAIAATAYRHVELIVIDNGSSDGSVAFIESFPAPFPVRVVRNTDNRSFAAANEQGAALATGEYLLFINNDIEPIGTSWLGHLVETIEPAGIAAVGARLIYPRRAGSPRAGARFRDLTLQHGGVGFAMRDGVPLGVPLEAGEDAASDWAAAVRDAPALTAACLLVRRTAFEAVGGFSDGYDYGHEDVDLCLMLRERGGRLVYDGRAALWHHESATRVTVDDKDVRRRRTAANRDLFVGRWGPRLYRTVMLDAVAGGPWNAKALHVGIIIAEGSTADPSRDAVAATFEGLCRGRGYWVDRTKAPDAGTLERSEIDVVVDFDPSLDLSVIPAALVRVAWSTGLAPGDRGGIVDAADIVIEDARERVDAAFVAALERWVRAPRIGIRVGGDAAERTTSSDDMAVASELREAFVALGWPTRVHTTQDETGWLVARDDVVIDLGAPVASGTPRGRCRVLLQTDRHDPAPPTAMAPYDLAFVVSETDARTMTDAFERVLARTPATIVDVASPTTPDPVGA